MTTRTPNLSTTFATPSATEPLAKFTDPDVTATGEPRARVALRQLETLWFNTGTLCNITCRNCYIESSPTNDALVYLTAAEVSSFLNEAKQLGTREIGVTGGEPFMNPEILAMLGEALAMGFDVLVLTNAMTPMQRPRIKEGLMELHRRFGSKLCLRVSLDHHTQARHEEERGLNTWQPAILGLDWLCASGFRTAIAGRTCWHETADMARQGYAQLFKERGWSIDADDAGQLMLFPEMAGSDTVPEITTRCWSILGKSPDEMMCASSRMVVKRNGAVAPVVLPCTLLPYDTAFEMGTTLADAGKADGGMFDSGAVKLCHRHCAEFCVLGGGSCS